ncbi:dihydrolipoyl dehydrogenase [Bacillus massilinigeriensis]|uniref:dihydrolipoyl dehydrogenase n=1 Tax=Bacillus mediterraneensis TaxID=1805474 RepID=UPI0008F84549|nr:dihydrolipoyl dehydrogenase [Bacillus mediterraneensis]
MVVGELAHERELIIIGGGPGGYHAAIRAAQLGKQVTLVEKSLLGGVCLNKGCIPSKVYTHAAERYHDAKRNKELGILTSQITIELTKLADYKNRMISQLREGVKSLCRENKVEILKGNAFFLSDDRIGVEEGDCYEVYRFTSAIIATGGVPRSLEGAPTDDSRIFNAWNIFELTEVPHSLIVMGDDYIALETAMAFRSFGSDVTIILPEGKSGWDFDASINRELTRVLKKSGITVLKNTSSIKVIADKDDISVSLMNETKQKLFTGTHLFYSLGIEPNIDHLGINRIGIELSEDGFILTDSSCRTSIPHIYAVGDVAGGKALASKAIRQAKVAAEKIGGEKSEEDFTYLPTVVQTIPPIAVVGLTEEEAIEKGFQVGTGEFPIASNGYASILGKKEGLAKIIFDKRTDSLLGVHLMGQGAVEMISNGITALEMAARHEDIIFPSYPHPSVNEAFLEAAEALKGSAIHLLPKKQGVKV